jgi:FkbM family methyltransferase
MTKHEIYNQIKEMGFNPKNIIDCGAAYGEWSFIARELFPESFILAIDASVWTENGISSANVTEISVLSNEDNKEMIFYKQKDKFIQGSNCTGDSLFRENTQHYQNHNTIEVKVLTKTLFHFVEKYNIDKIDLLKIDTQGSELIIMEGLGKFLSSVEFIELECSIIEYNIGGCSLLNILNFLSNDFEIFDILDTHRHYGFLSQIDILFKNKKSQIKKLI